MGPGPGAGELPVAVVGEAAGVAAVAVVAAVAAADQVEAGGAAHPAVVHPGQLVPGVQVVAGPQPVSPAAVGVAARVGAGLGGARHPPTALQRRPGQTQAGLGACGLVLVVVVLVEYHCVLCWYALLYACRIFFE